MLPASSLTCECLPLVADFTLSPTVVYFNSSSVVGDMRCFVLETVNDMIIEDDEVMSFEAGTRSEFDVFVDGMNGFSLTIYDDDGM